MEGLAPCSHAHRVLPHSGKHPRNLRPGALQCSHVRSVPRSAGSRVSCNTWCVGQSVSPFPQQHTSIDALFKPADTKSLQPARAVLVCSTVRVPHRRGYGAHLSLDESFEPYLDRRVVDRGHRVLDLAACALVAVHWIRRDPWILSVGVSGALGRVPFVVCCVSSGCSMCCPNDLCAVSHSPPSLLLCLC